MITNCLSFVVTVLLRLVLHTLFLFAVLYPASYVVFAYGVPAMGDNPGAAAAAVPVVLLGYAGLLLVEAGVVGYRAHYQRWWRASAEYLALVCGAVSAAILLMAALVDSVRGFPLFAAGPATWLVLFLLAEFFVAAAVRFVLLAVIGRWRHG